VLRFRRAIAPLPPLPRFFVSFIFAWFDVFGSWFLVFSVFGFQGTNQLFHFGCFISH
jgi:hypothetical protein